jgi:predicted ArsR family transcriptional regulator
VARALGEPARMRIFQVLIEHQGPADVASVAEAVDLHPNAVRRHLRHLVEAGLATEVAVPAGRGRPRHVFAPVPGAADPWLATRRYGELARLLGEAVRTGATPREVGRRAALRSEADGAGGGSGDRPSAAHATATDPTAADPGGETASDDAASRFVDALGRWGFAPQATRHDDEIDVTLRACPYGEAVETEAAVICALHLGLAEGLAAASGGLEVASLEARPPAERACRLHVRVLPGGDDEAAGTL